MLNPKVFARETGREHFTGEGTEQAKGQGEERRVCGSTCVFFQKDGAHKIREYCRIFKIHSSSEILLFG